MNCVIPYTKEIIFKTKIAEISSISLEHEMNINDSELLGNFIVSGEYKSHELSVNKDEFSYTLPFSIDLSDTVDLETIDFSITDFSYEVINDNTLKVFIEFSVFASEKEIVVEDEKRDELFQDASTAFQSEVEVEIPEVPVLEKQTEINDRKEEDIMIDTDLEERIDSEDTETIINSINNDNDNDTYALYHIHIVKDAETIELISSKYNTSIDLINEYNDLSNVGVGDKLIIPEEKDE